MTNTITRRTALHTIPAIGVSLGALFGVSREDVRAQDPSPTTPEPWPGFPRMDPKLVSEVVGMAHRDEARVRELVTAHPPLVNAWWDWGFGDWESPLGAASHVGQRGIAEFLLEKGARIDIFAAAMLGKTAVVKAFVEAQPSIQRTPGPHGIPLLAHAKAGGEKAADTFAYLESLGDAGAGYAVTTLPDDRKEVYFGTYVSDEAGVSMECRVNQNGQLVIEVRPASGTSSRPSLHFMGNDEFYPSGVPSVRFKFSVADGKAKSVTVLKGGPVFTAVLRT